MTCSVLCDGIFWKFLILVEPCRELEHLYWTESDLWPWRSFVSLFSNWNSLLKVSELPVPEYFFGFLTNIFCACVTFWNLISCSHLSIWSAIAFIVKRIGSVKPFMPNIWFCSKTFRIFDRWPKHHTFLKGMVLTSNHTPSYSFFDTRFLFLHSLSGWAKVLPDVFAIRVCMRYLLSDVFLVCTWVLVIV